MGFGRRINTKNEFKVQAADLALEKHPPFHRNKNSVADAILFLSVLSFLEKEPDAILYFVTDNKSDFSDVNNQSNIHPLLKQMAEEKGITLHYSLDLNTTLEEIFSEVTDVEYVKSYKEAYYQKYHVNFKNRCKNKKCQGRMVMDTHPWDGRGHKIFYKCERCSNVEKTDEYVVIPHRYQAKLMQSQF
ncbi:PIN domain-containing protein [Bacillus mycoides]|uniref:PIN domain-containing protein n=1 Tax=Bacillus mycoides TaxID=1405 RepID=UPI000A27EAC0|nr:PIN domain-containing protein [Bacillus mycoides]OSX90164.1 hypothetical protein BTJ44_01550 [Bacillus mycoides]